MSFYCFRCQAEIQLAQDTPVGRKDECPKCRADLHVCLNCKHHDRTAYNECRESQADRVLDKDRSNFCDYFSFKEGKSNFAAQNINTLKQLDDLFKK